LFKNNALLERKTLKLKAMTLINPILKFIKKIACSFNKEIEYKLYNQTINKIKHQNCD